MLDRAFIGRRTGPVVYEVEAWHVRRFADAIGDPSPLYRDEEQARAAGYAAIPAPPTFAAALRPEDLRSELGIDFRRILHGEQSYTYARPLLVGDVVSVTASISDLYEKVGRSGTMGFIVLGIEGRGRSGELIFEGRTVTVIRP